jgi:hypothetical protein
MRPTDLTASGREWRDTLAAVRRAVDLELTGSQRAIFAAATLGHLPPEALTCGLGPDRNAIYRALFEARRRVGSRLTADGLLQADDVPRQTATHLGGYGRYWPPILATPAVMSHSRPWTAMPKQNLRARIRGRISPA